MKRNAVTQYKSVERREAKDLHVFHSHTSACVYGDWLWAHKTLELWFQPGIVLPIEEILAMFRDGFGCHSRGMLRHLAGRGQGCC